MDGSVFEFTSELWLYPGAAGWYFVTLPVEVADDIDEMVDERAGFGSIPVEVTVGIQYLEDLDLPRQTDRLVRPTGEESGPPEGGSRS